MGNPFVIKAISPELSFEIDEMIKKIKDNFNYPIGKIQASKIIAWKSKNYKMDLTGKRLIEILGGKTGEVENKK